ncbi:MAG TPA: cytochrome c class I [Cyclobacteriaceae bacterium]|nr:cytochrome c class I [Cyclobacteriaceae bacterium]
MMKMTIRLFVTISFGVMLACGGEKKQETGEQIVANDAPVEKQAGADLIAQGEALVKGSDCKTCHHSVNKIIGPSHTDVAKKYEFNAANVKMLAEKIIKGGTGVWGQSPMTPHPDLTVDQAEKMARYVLSLDGEKEH